jgi:hypothetical protein
MTLAANAQAPTSQMRLKTLVPAYLGVGATETLGIAGLYYSSE